MKEIGYTTHDGMPDRESMVGELQDVSAESRANANSMIATLTAEAKFVLYAIFNTPGELSELLLGDKLTKSNLRKYLRLMGWKKRYIVKTMKELDTFTEELFS